jgi:hypothetical protein
MLRRMVRGDFPCAMLQNAWPAAIGIYAKVLQYRPFGPLRLPQRAGRTPAESKQQAGSKPPRGLLDRPESPIEPF